MKDFRPTTKILLAIMLVLSFFNACAKEDNKENILLSDDKVWIEDIRWVSNPSLKFTETFYIGNDTIINNKTYKKILCTRTGSSKPNSKSNFNNAVVCFARETVDGKIYQLISNEEYLFYDFSLSVGDTIGDDPFRGSWRVVKVDEILVSGHLKKRLSLDSRCSSDKLVWIESIGSSQGLFYKGRCHKLIKNELGLRMVSIGGSSKSRVLVKKDDEIIYKKE